MDWGSLFLTLLSAMQLVWEQYLCFRTFRKTYDKRALDEGVQLTDVLIVKGLKSRENSKVNKPNQYMYLHYAQPELLIEPFKRYTSHI